MKDLLTGFRKEMTYKTADVIDRLKERSRLSRNKPIYIPGAVEIDFEKAGWKGPKNISLLDFFIARYEAPFAEIGRFLYHDQQPVTDPNLLPGCVVERAEDDYVIYPVRIPVRKQIMDFYMQFLDRLCEPGNNPKIYGQTAADADLIIHVNDRIITGKAIAESKLRDPECHDKIIENLDNTEKLIEILRNEEIEKGVLEETRSVAEDYELNPDLAEEFVRWMIDITLRTVEVEYLRQELKR
jgi:chorismate mutase